MTVTPAQLRSYANWTQDQQDDFLQQFIDDALAQQDPCVWGALLDQGTKTLALHLCASDSWAAGLRLVDENGSTVYGQRYKALEALVTPGVTSL
jgi:hypothetical protein